MSADITSAPMAPADWLDTVDARCAMQVAAAADERARRNAAKRADPYAAALAELKARFGRDKPASNVPTPRNGPALGWILWRGRSLYDGAPLVAIATDLDGGSNNRKTGAECQVWILREDIAPHDAVATGADVSTCGGCQFRPMLAGQGAPCYVDVFHAPLSVWRAYHSGAYAPWDGVSRPSAPVRAGAYGDPALVPAHVWSAFGVATGYTHAWREPWAAEHRAWLMASVDGPADLEAARAAGWRAFYVREPGATTAIDGAIRCPSPRVKCADCRLCGGLQRAGAKDVWTPAHGKNAEYRHGRPQIAGLGDTLRHERLLRIL
jgi:hypothetical protein